MDGERLIGRDGPAAELAAAIAAAQRHGAAILLAGERGIGKTALVRAGQSLARSAGHRLIATVGSRDEQGLPFAALQRLLHPLLSTVDTLPAVQREALLIALGMLEGPEPDLFVVSLASLNVIGNASNRRALTLTVDDLQWLDDASRQVLTFVARRLETRRVVLIAASSGRTTPGVAGAFQEVRLGRLDAETAGQLLAERAPHLEPSLLKWVIDQADGNPLALVELATMGSSVSLSRTDPYGGVHALTPLLKDAFAQRLTEHSPLTRDIMLVAAVAFDESLQEILAASTVLSGRAAVLAALDAPCAAGLLSYDETRLWFSHPLVKSAVAQGESVGRRQAAHRALGEVVVVNSGRRAWHRANGTAGYDDAVALELEQNSADSTRRGDPTAAIMALERAAQLTTLPRDRGRRLLLAAEQAAVVARFEMVDRLLVTATSGELSDVDRVKAELLRDDYDDLAVGDTDQVLRLCALSEAAAANGRPDFALELAYAAGRRRSTTWVSVHADQVLGDVAENIARGQGGPRVLAVLALADAVRHGRHVLTELAQTNPDTLAGAGVLEAVAVAVRAVGDYGNGAELLRQSELRLRDQGLAGALSRVLCVSAEVALCTGDWTRASASVAELTALTAESFRAVHRAEVLVTTAKAAALRGESLLALDLVAEVEHAPDVRRGSSILARAQIARGIAYLSSGRHVEAFAALGRVFNPRDPSHVVREQFEAVMYLAEAASRSGQPEEARAILAQMESAAASCPSPLLLTHLEYARAVLAEDDKAERQFLTCLASELAMWPWPRARAQLAYGRWLRRQRRVSQSRVPLQAAYATLREIGASSWAAEALVELEAAGSLTEDRRAESVAAQLSVQELTIARLAAQGLTNVEIAQQLCLSARTVGSHLYRIFPKLGVTGRGEIASRLSAQQVG